MMRTCYLVAAPGARTSPLRSALIDLGVHTIAAEETPPPGVASPEALAALMNASDFVIGVITSRSKSASVQFELGLAVGLKKPIFLIAEPSSDVPISLEAMPYVRAQPEDMSAIRFHLRAFLTALQRSTPAPTQTRGPDVKPPPYQQQRDVTNVADESESELEFQIAVALHQVGYQVQAEPVVSGGGRVTRPDFVVWVRGIPESLGNPVVVEVKRRSQSDQALVAQARKYLRATRLRTAVMVVGSRNAPLTAKLTDAGYVFLCSVGEFFDLIDRQRLIPTLVRERNRVAHGEGD